MIFSLYGLVIGIATALAVNYFQNHNRTVPKSQEGFFILSLLLISFIGARFYHVVDYWSFYSKHPLQIINTRAGGLAIYGGLLFGLGYIYTYSYIYKLKHIDILDQISPIIPLCQAVGRFGNYFNHEIPIWWLESALCFLLYIYIRYYPKNSTAKYLIGYGIIRFTDEFFRSDTWVITNIKVAQLISVIFILTGIKLLHGSRHKIL